MSDWVIYSIGFLAQILFSARTLVQWVVSEKNKKVMTPTSFWVLSIFGSFLMFLYGDFRDDFAIMFGQVVTYFIYLRNLHLQGQWNKIRKPVRTTIIIVSIVVFVYGFSDSESFDRLFRNENIPFWLLVLGIIAQIVFVFRFIYQWAYSEKKKESSLPLGFWLLSLTGSTLILIYAVFRMDPVLLAGHIFGLVVYIRNIYLNYNENKQ
jgi:lipid-A-disaccharide synthase-like uncharacterized protein